MALSRGTWRHMDQRIGAQPIAETSTTQRHTAGIEVQAMDAGTTAYGVGTFVYLKGVANTAVGSWVTMNMDDGTTTLLAANAIGPVGIAMSANVANQWGWYQRVGKAIGKCLTGYADNGKVYITATSGSVDDASIAGDLVVNAKGASAVDTLEAEFEIDRPFVADVFP